MCPRPFQLICVPTAGSPSDSPPDVPTGESHSGAAAPPSSRAAAVSHCAAARRGVLARRPAPNITLRNPVNTSAAPSQALCLSALRTHIHSFTLPPRRSSMVEATAKKSDAVGPEGDVKVQSVGQRGGRTPCRPVSKSCKGASGRVGGCRMRTQPC